MRTRRRRDAHMLAHEQRLAELRLEQTDVLADRTLCQREFIRGAREALQPYRRFEGT